MLPFANVGSREIAYPFTVEMSAFIAMLKMVEDVFWAPPSILNERGVTEESTTALEETGGTMAIGVTATAAACPLAGQAVVENDAVEDDPALALGSFDRTSK